MSEINAENSPEMKDDLVTRLETPVSERLTNVLVGLHVGLEHEFASMEADMAAAAKRIVFLEQQVSRLEQKIDFLSAATNKSVDLVDQAKEALQTCIVSMEGDCSDHHKIALRTADQAFRRLSKVEALPMSPEGVSLLSIAEQHRWAITPQVGGGWIIETADDYGDDGQERELVRTRKSLTAALMEAVEDELPKEFEWLLLARRHRQLAYVPDGWKILPDKLTSDMEDAAYDALAAFEKAETGAWCGLSSAYDAMIAKAPPPPQKLFPVDKSKAAEKAGWDAETYFNELVDYSWDKYRAVVFDVDTVKPKVGQYQAESRAHLRKIYADAREKFPEFADTLLWILRYKGIEANRHANLAQSFGVGRYVAKDDESLWSYWRDKARRNERSRMSLISALKSLVNGASPPDDALDHDGMALVKMSNIREGEYALQDAGEPIRSGGVV
ncbi:hypothetical protein [Rhizobium sp. MHM7A]|uniref:hypothetical protein n=1 Tax=Rhizobium sp. MHM7A TaxID=2583233 RepID=UPI001106400D|nr:hypothetical protein [Rhizobium sp. MHM7A]TLX16124.1 hypothetical protein FFR93_02025 [Rhizobium sp. MHM7A]